MPRSSRRPAGPCIRENQQATLGGLPDAGRSDSVARRAPTGSAGPPPGGSSASSSGTETARRPRRRIACRICGIAAIVTAWMSCISTIAPGRRPASTLRSTDFTVASGRVVARVDRPEHLDQAERPDNRVGRPVVQLVRRAEEPRLPAEPVRLRRLVRASSSQTSQRGCAGQPRVRPGVVAERRRAASPRAGGSASTRSRLPTRKNVAWASPAARMRSRCAVYGPGPVVERERDGVRTAAAAVDRAAARQRTRDCAAAAPTAAARAGGGTAPGRCARPIASGTSTSAVRSDRRQAIVTRPMLRWQPPGRATSGRAAPARSRRTAS